VALGTGQIRRFAFELRFNVARWLAFVSSVLARAPVEATRHGSRRQDAWRFVILAFQERYDVLE